MRGKVRVLIADDEERFVQSLAKVLRNREMEILTARDGAAALQLLSCTECDVVVLDLRMPGMDGLTVLKEIRKSRPLLPVILLSGHLDVESCRLACDEGAEEVLMKPCPIDTLATAIENASERKAIAEEVSARRP
ncbi:MAG: response regulator [Desulfobacterales bacterium]